MRFETASLWDLRWLWSKDHIQCFQATGLRELDHKKIGMLDDGFPSGINKRSKVNRIDKFEK